MSFDAIWENKIVTKISESIVNLNGFRGQYIRTLAAKHESIFGNESGI